MKASADSCWPLVSLCNKTSRIKKATIAFATKIHFRLSVYTLYRVMTSVLNELDLANNVSKGSRVLLKLLERLARVRGLVEKALVLIVLYAFYANYMNDNYLWSTGRHILDHSLLINDSFECSKLTGNLTQCPQMFGKLSPRFHVRLEYNKSFTEGIPRLYNVQPGGIHVPQNCTPRFKVAIIVPFRNREAQLKLFLQHMHPFLHDQLVSYIIVVVEQTREDTFNKGRLMNTAVVEVLKRNRDICCIILHDVDLLPENQNNLYTCSRGVKHMSPAVSTMRYKPMYYQLIGGVLAMRVDHFKKVNGYTNAFFGWGGEDDDFWKRVFWSKLSIVRWPVDISRYFMLYHKKEKPNNKRYQLLKATRSRYKQDGLSDLHTMVVSVTNEPLYTHILVEVVPKDKSSMWFDAFDYYTDKKLIEKEAAS